MRSASLATMAMINEREVRDNNSEADGELKRVSLHPIRAMKSCSALMLNTTSPLMRHLI